MQSAADPEATVVRPSSLAAIGGKYMTHKITVAALVALSMLSLAACEKQGPAERVGEKIDHTVDAAKNGGEEPASDKLEDAAHNAQDAAADATDAAKDSVKKD
jgi:hypothetical protein